MGIKCSLLGHRFGETTVERDREEDGTEVVITITEFETCTRCGETRVVSENKEVTTLEDADAGNEAGSAVDAGATDAPATGPGNATDADGTDQPSTDADGTDQSPTATDGATSTTAPATDGGDTDEPPVPANPSTALLAFGVVIVILLGLGSLAS